MRKVVFLALAWLAMRLAPHTDEPEPQPQIIEVGPNSPFLFSVDGMAFYGWRTFDGTALIPAPGIEQPPEVS